MEDSAIPVDGKKLEDIPIARDFPKVFPEDLTRLPPLRQTKFRIDLVLEATHVAKALYRLAPPEKKRDTSYQRQVFTRKHVFTIPSTAYPPSAIRHQQIRRIHHLDTTYQPFHSEQRIDFYSLNNVYVLPNNTRILYNQYGVFTFSRQYDVFKLIEYDVLEIIRRTMAKLILNEARAEQYLTEPSIESNEKYELGEELLKELRSNSYSERVEEDVVGHIAKILEILDPIEVDAMDPFQLRMMTFPLSLSGKARKWWMNEGDGKINTWEELVNKFFSKFYPISYANNYDKMCVDDEEEVGNNEGLMDEDISSGDDRDQTNLSMITKPEIKIGDEFLKILHDNSFNGMDGSDVTEHIRKVLEITEWIKIPNVDKDELRLKVFSKSLSGDAKKWWDNERTSTTWKELCDKFFHKYYPWSHTYKSKIPDDLGHRTDYFEFLYWLASKFNNYWELDKNVKNRLWEFYVNGRTKRTINDLVNYNEPREESNEKTCSDLFFKPYLDAQDGKDFYEIIDRDYSPIQIPAHHDISNPDELCQTEEFTVVWYSVGSCKE
ncbi:hypothetical protein Tco_0693083 [Tanacetum coccineum]